MSYLAYEPFEKKEYGVIRGGLSGQSGDMPPELWMRKVEQTPMYEPDDMLDDHFRSALKDRTPDAPTLAQDMPRSERERVGQEVMKLRYNGARSAAEPIHPDLFLGFTERDERGYVGAPNMGKVRGHSERRMKYKDLTSDHFTDASVPESQRSEMRAIRDLRSTIDASRQRLKIFDTSRDGRSTSRAKTPGKHKLDGKARATMDGIIMNINDATAEQRRDNTSLKGDLIKTGYRQTGDHRYQVAQYGLVSKKQQVANIHSSQQFSQLAHKYDIMPDEVKARMAQRIVDEVKRRQHYQTYKGEMEFNKSYESKNIVHKLIADMRTALGSAKRTHDTTELGYMSANARKVKLYDPVSKSSVVVDADLFAKISEHKNVSFRRTVDNSFRRNTHVKNEQPKGELHGLKAMMYSRKAPEKGKVKALQTHEWAKTRFDPVYKRNHTFPQYMDVNSTEQEQGVIANHVFNRTARGLGKKTDVRKGIDTAVFNPNPAGDTVSRISRY